MPENGDIPIFVFLMVLQGIKGFEKKGK